MTAEQKAALLEAFGLLNLLAQGIVPPNLQTQAEALLDRLAREWMADIEADLQEPDADA